MKSLNKRERERGGGHGTDGDNEKVEDGHEAKYYEQTYQKVRYYE